MKQKQTQRPAAGPQQAKTALPRTAKPAPALSRAERTTLLRHWATLRAIPRYPAKRTAAQLLQALTEAGHTATKRTVERDLQLLSAAFPLQCDEREKPYGWSWMREAEPLQVPMLSAPEAVVFRLVDLHLGALLPAAMRNAVGPYFRQAERALAHAPQGMAARKAAAWLAKLRTVQPTQPLIPPRIAPAVLDAVSSALLEGRQIDATYRKRGGDHAIKYRLHPLAIVQRGVVAYLVASAFGHDDALLFALHRFTSAHVAEPEAVVPSGFDLDAYLASGALGFRPTGKRIALELLVSEGVAEHLAEAALAPDQKIAPHGSEFRVTATAADTSQLRWWLLGFGAEVEVLTPAALRRELAVESASLAERYRRPTR